MATDFYITNSLSNQVLDIPLDAPGADDGEKIGLLVQQWHNHGGKNQQWYLARPINPAASGYQIINRHSGYSLGITANTSPSNPWIGQYTPQDSELQLWNLLNPVSSLPSGLNIINKMSGQVLDLPIGEGGWGAAQQQGLHIQQHAAKPNPALPNQEWNLVPVSGPNAPTLYIRGELLPEYSTITISGSGFTPGQYLEIWYWTTLTDIISYAGGSGAAPVQDDGTFSMPPFNQPYVAVLTAEQVGSNWVSIYAQDADGGLLAVTSAPISYWATS